MDHCKHEGDIKRIIKILDGNGEKGIQVQLTVLKEESKVMNHAIECLKEQDNEILTAINAFSKYMTTEEIVRGERDKVRKDREMDMLERSKERKNMTKFIIAQVIVVIGLLVGMLLK